MKTDFNNLLVSGYYFGKLTQNTPDGTTDSNWIIEVQAFDNNPNYVYQRATRASNRLMFTRYRNGSAWSNWEEGATKSDLDSRASCDSWVTDLDSAPKAIILRTNTDPTGYPTNLGGNSCLAFQLNPGTKYSAQLAFSFSKDRLAIRRKNNSDTWTAWKYVDFTIS